MGFVPVELLIFMTLPAFLFALLLASLYGAAYHFIRDGGGGHLTLFLVLSGLGFAAGHIFSLWLDWDFILLGQIRLGFSSVGSLIVLILGDWLSRIEPRPESKV